MATKKEKLIEEAQRCSLRGQVDKAVSAYRELLAMEPNAVNHRQRLAELLVKGGKLEEARVEFEAIGKHYANNGFYLKAIAVYKQIQKFFPDDITLSLTLAGLNEKHGLTANALAEYKTVADYYEKNGKPSDVLKILEKMQGVDSGNINVKLKLAEAYFQAGQVDESYKTFGKLATLLQERGEHASFAKLNARIQKLFPLKSAFMLEVFEEQIASGHAASAVSGLQEMLRTNPDDKRVWDLVITAYGSLNQPQRLKNAYTHYLKFFPHEPNAQIGLIGCVANEQNLSGALELLERFEQELLNAGQWQAVVEKYRQLELLDPINLAVLEGLERAYRAGNREDEVAILLPKIKSLKSLADDSAVFEQGDNVFGDASVFSAGDSCQPVLADEPEELLELPLDEMHSFAEPQEHSEPSFTESIPVLEALPGSDALPSALDEEIEIEIDFDDVSGFAENTDAVTEPVLGDNWLDSVDGYFDTVATAPRGVKFGSDTETVDSQSHYDLGVAFKEMGLYDEAINELHQAAVDSRMKVACLILQGACLREKGELVKAENVLRTMLKPGLSPEDSCQVRYELALTCASAGKQDEAAALLADIEATNPGFRDVRTLLDAAVLDENSLDFSDEELKGFDLK